MARIPHQYRRWAGYGALVLIAALAVFLDLDDGWWSIVVLDAMVAILLTMFERRPVLRRLGYLVVVIVLIAVLISRYGEHRHWNWGVTDVVILFIAAVMGVVALDSRRPVRTLWRRIRTKPRDKTFAVILNPIKVESVGGFKALVDEVARETGWDEPTWFLTTPEETGAGLALEAARTGVDLVLVCGGDGTVRDVCAALADTEIPVGIVPTGTGNLLARNLHLPLYLRGAIDTALTGRNRRIDLAAVEGDGLRPTHFLVMAGMGFDAEIMEGVDDDIKRRVGWLAYVVSGAQALSHAPFQIEISVDGGTFSRYRAKTVVVGNVGTLQGGVPLLPDAEIDDGLLDVVILSPQRLVQWVPTAVRLLSGRRESDELVTRLRGKSVVVRSPQPMPRQLDGDLIAPGGELRIRCEPGRVIVRVPR